MSITIVILAVFFGLVGLYLNKFISYMFAHYYKQTLPDFSNVGLIRFVSFIVCIGLIIFAFYFASQEGDRLFELNKDDSIVLLIFGLFMFLRSWLTMKWEKHAMESYKQECNAIDAFIFRLAFAIMGLICLVSAGLSYLHE